MINAANTMNYNMANDGSCNKEMESESLRVKWIVMQSPNNKTRVVLLATRAVKVSGLHIG
jgi:hypothetical protein